MSNSAQRILKALRWSLTNPIKAFKGLESTAISLNAMQFADIHAKPLTEQRESKNEFHTNPLRTYFDNHLQGNGIWKWIHYFDIYHRHFQKFRNSEVTIVEIGVYSGGSLGMWRDYFGAKCKIYGIDIQPECKAYEDDQISIFIGDQSDRSFWKKFKQQVPRVDILIDDGGHQTDQQIVTLEEMLPFLSPGGVYLCEDVHGDWNNFADYMTGLQKKMNHQHFTNNETFTSLANDFQKQIHSIHSYPFVYVIEKNNGPQPDFTAPKHGTSWEPFL